MGKISKFAYGDWGGKRKDLIEKKQDHEEHTNTRCGWANRL